MTTLDDKSPRTELTHGTTLDLEYGTSSEVVHEEDPLGAQGFSQEKTEHPSEVDMDIDTIFNEISNEIREAHARRRVNLTAYRLLTMAILLAFGTVKARESWQNHSISATWVEWVGGACLAASWYFVGLYEDVTPPVAEWFFHEHYGPELVFLPLMLVAIFAAWTLFVAGLWLYTVTSGVLLRNAPGDGASLWSVILIGMPLMFFGILAAFLVCFAAFAALCGCLLGLLWMASKLSNFIHPRARRWILKVVSKGVVYFVVRWKSYPLIYLFAFCIFGIGSFFPALNCFDLKPK